MDGREAAQITVRVLAARNLQSRRKGEETCVASVVFGVGKDCYMTEGVVNNNPEWNQEARINLPQRNHSSEVKFKVRDKDHTLGVATIPILNLARRREVSKKWLPLTPHKKSHEAHGDILIECFVSETRPGMSRSENPSLSNSQEDLHTGHRMGSGIVRGMKDRFSLHKRNPSWTKTSSPNSPSPKRLSGSDIELHARPGNRMYTSEGNIRGGSSPDHSRSEISGDSLLSSELENQLTPEVSGISPREGLVEGGQRVVLRGSCLGECRSDVVRVVIADVDCTESLEYHSQSKLVVTTAARHAPGVGPVLVETRTGGVGVSSLKFSFTTGEVSHPPEVSGISPREGLVEGGQRVVLRGSCLGECRSDVVRVVIADVDCTETLEYISNSKLIVTTLPISSPMSGPVVVETVQGGVGTSSLTFSYVTDCSTGGVVSLRKDNSSSKLQKPEIDPVEFKALKQQLRDLKDDNTRLKDENAALRGYIDHLLLSVIEVKPDLLEVKPAPAAPLTQSRSSLIST